MLYKLTSAALTGTLIALAVDLLLQAGLGMIGGNLRRMILIGTLFERLRWTVAVALIRAVAPSIDRWLAHAIANFPTLSTRGAWSLIGIVMLAFPAAWEVAMLLIMAIRVVMAGTWMSGFQIFLEPSFYSDLIVGYAPWLIAGATLLAWARHVEDKR